jgi:16S rRNA (cytosine967-C5)-methyltransferase
VLRTVDREGRPYLEKETSVFDNCEPRLIKEWIKAYGEEKTTAIVDASMEQSPIFLSVNQRTGSIKGASSDAKIQKIADQFATSNDDEVEILPQGSIRIPKRFMGAVASWPLYEKGDWWVQDPSATLPAIALHSGLCSSSDGQSSAAAADMYVVDLCSAPGGKTVQLCSLGFGKVSAVELSSRRTKPLNDNLRRLNMEQFCEVHVADGREWMPNEGDKIHGVLVDAPCSATGVGSRRPDVLRKSPDIDELLATQQELAAHAADKLIEAGGILVYATCSLLQQESEDQMKWLLSRSEGAAELETLPFLPGEIPGFDDAIDENGWLRVLPGALPGSLGYCDGFFVARLRKIR